MINDIDWKICIHGYTFERYFKNIEISYKKRIAEHSKSSNHLERFEPTIRYLLKYISSF